ncbi:hypothetical protein NESM_000876100 [Novymonas esmeraldas]|uniref:Secreted protein n=1 Tax=Novymonas esmeraldas TaxID=1808958 RepID=A0AAW0EY54_9TRYP
MLPHIYFAFIAIAGIVIMAVVVVYCCGCCCERKPEEESNDPVTGEAVGAGSVFANRNGSAHERPVTAIVVSRGPQVGTVVPDGPTYSTPYGCEAVQYGEAVYVAHPDGDGASTSNHARQLKPESHP